MQERFFIFDCLGLIVGNHKGYATHKGAIIALRMHGMRLEKILWARFDDILKAGHKPEKPGIIWSIRPMLTVNIETVKG